MQNLLFHKYFWRVIGSIIALGTVYISISMTFFFFGSIHAEHKRPISDRLGYYTSSNKSYVYNLLTNEVIIPDVSYIAEPHGNDSIAVFRWGEKRGYFNINSGEIISQPQYEAAWIFSSGVGVVAKNDSIIFIGIDGKPIHNKKFKRIKGEDYLYKGEYCIIKIGDKYGVIDKSGEWVIEPKWDYAEVATNGLLKAWKNGWAYTVYPNDTIMPFPKYIDIKNDTIYSFSDSVRIYIRHKESEPR